MKNSVFFLANRQGWASFCLIFSLLVLGSMDALGATKTWLSTTTGGAWTASTNWSPSGIPVAGDVVIIGGSGTIAINNVPTISLAELRITNTNSTGVTLSSSSTSTITAALLTVSGYLTTTSTVNLVITNGTIASTERLNIGSGRTLTVNGLLTVNSNGGGTTSTLPLYVLGSAIVNSGGEIAYGTGTSSVRVAGNLTINAGGTLSLNGSGSPILNSNIVINGTFEVGGTITAIASSPNVSYGASGNLVYNGTSTTSAITANFYEWPSTNPPLNITIDHAKGVTIGSLLGRTITGTLTLTRGVLTLPNYAPLIFHTSNTPIVRTNGTISLSSTGGDLTFGTTGNTGGNAFTIPAGTFTSTALTFDNFTVNRTNALTLNNQDLNVSTMTLTSGLVIVGSGSITIDAVSGTPSSTKMLVTSATSGYVKHLFPIAGDAFTFPIGDNVGTTEYSPIDLTVSATSVDRTIGFRAVDAAHPSLNLPSVPANSLSRYWDSNLSTAAGTYDYDLDMNYLQADVIGALEANIAPVAWDGSQPWNQYPGSINTTTNILSIESASSGTAPLGLPLTGREGAVGPNLVVSASAPNASTTPCLSTSMDYLVEIKNSGNQAIAPGTSIVVSAYTNSLTCGGVAVSTQSFTTGLAANAAEVLTFSLPNIGNGQVSFQVDPSNTIAEINDGDNCLSDNTVTVNNSLSGTYTIGGTTPDYGTFAAAIADLGTKGVCGPVTFNVRQGSYPEQVTINTVSGGSAINTVTFQADPANSSPAILTYGSQGVSNNYVLTINNASYLRFYNLNIVNTAASTTYKRVVEFVGATNDIIFDGNNLETGSASGNSNATTVFLVDAILTSVNTNTVITNNTITGGGNGIDLTATNANQDAGNRIEGNTITGFNSNGISATYQNGIIVANNTINSNSTLAAIGIELANVTGSMQVTGNNIEITGTGTKTGIYLNIVTGTSGNRFLVANNLVSVIGTTSGVNSIYAGTPSYVDFAFNNLYAYGTGSSNETFNLNGGSNTRLYNNNMVAEGTGYAFYTGNVSFIAASNYNNFYTTTANYMYASSARANLTAWQLTGFDGNSLSIDPQYLSTTAPTDLHVANGTLAGAGTAFGGIVTDVDGDSRTTPPTIGADEVTASAADAGIIAVVTPAAPLCAGNSNVVVTVENFGATVLTSVTVNWSVNGGGIVSQTFSGLSVASGATTNLNLGGFTFANNTSYVITAATADPNSVTDADGSNDSYTAASILAVNAGTWTGVGGDNDWHNPTNWSCNTVPTPTIDVVIPTGISTYPVLVTVAGNPVSGSTRNITIASGASITIAGGGNVINVSGNLTNSGVADFGQGALRFTNAGAHTIAGGVNIGILTIEAATTLTGNAKITEALNLVAGNLNTTGGALTLRSNALTTAYINDFTSGYTGTITGNVTVERFVSNTVGGFHYVGAPVGGTTISDWTNEFNTAGPNNVFVTPQPTCDPNALAQGSAYGGLFDYRESNVTTCYQSGWRVRSSGALGATEGYAGVIPNSTTINLTGTANTGNINSASLSRTVGNGTSTQGMHMVSNPYPSAIDWYQVAAANTDLDGTAYLWLTSGGYQGTYQPVNAITPGSSFIGSSQGYFVEALTNGAALNYNNTMRVAGNNNFARTGQAFDSRLILEVAGNGYNDRTIVAFGADFTHGYDREFDGKKMQSKAGVMTLYTHTNSNYARQATNALPNDRSVKVVPVGFAAGANGTFTFNATDLGTFTVGTLVYLEDTKTGTFTNLMVTPTYTFSGNTTDAEARFVLHFVPAPIVTKVDADCSGNNASVSVDLGAFALNNNSIVWDNITLQDANGNNVWSAANASGLQMQTGLNGGNYTLVLAIGGYTVNQTIVIGAAPLVTATAVASETNVLEGEVISFGNNSNGATSYTWNFGDGSTSTDANPAYSYTQEGVYVATLTATNGTCTDVFTQNITVSKAQGPTSIDNVDGTNGIRIFGFGNTVTVRFSNWNGEQAQMDIYDLVGRKVVNTITLDTNTSEHQIMMPEVANGYYFVCINGANGLKTERIYLEK